MIWDNPRKRYILAHRFYSKNLNQWCVCDGVGTGWGSTLLDAAVAYALNVNELCGY